MLDPRENCAPVDDMCVFPNIDYTMYRMTEEVNEDMTVWGLTPLMCAFPWRMGTPANMRIIASQGTGALNFYHIVMKLQCPCFEARCAVCRGTRRFRDVAYWYVEGRYLTALAERCAGLDAVLARFHA
jgi:hypothetical protein